MAPVRRWRLTLTLMLFSCSVAGSAAYAFGQKLWQVEGTIIYTPLSLGGLSHLDYTPPGPQTLISLVKSPQRLERIVQDLQLPVQSRVMERALKVNQQPNVDAVRLTLDWPDQDVGRAIIDRLMETYIRDTVELRRGKIRETLLVLQNESASNRLALEGARSAYAALPDRVTQSRLTAEGERNLSHAAMLQLETSQISEKLSSCRHELARARGVAKADTDGKPTVVEDALFRERKQALLDSVRHQQDKVKEIDVEVEAKKKELANHQRLLDSGVGTRLDHSKTVGELDLLLARRGTAVKVAEDQTVELSDLPRRHARNAINRLEAEEAELESKATVTKRNSDDNRREMVRIGELSSLEQTARRYVEQAESDVRGVRVRLEALERLRDGAVTEFASVQPAAVSSHPTSNRKTLGILMLAGLMMLFLAGIVGHAWLTGSPSPHDPHYGLPIAARIDHPSPGSLAPATEARRLALQLRDPVRESGGIVLFATAEQSLHTEDIVWQLAHYLSLAGEEVLILDCRIHAPASASAAAASQPDLHAGLSHYLQRRVTDELAIIRSTGRPGLRFVPSGENCLDPDLLASVVMQNLLVTLSEQWDRILLIGPSLDCSLGAEILARYADGAIVVCGQDCVDSPAAHGATIAIRRAGVPWVGAVVRTCRDEDEFLPFAIETLDPVAPASRESSREQLGVMSVTWSQSARSGGNPPAPIESEALEPFGGSLHSTDQRVKRGPDLKTYRGT